MIQETETFKEQPEWWYDAFVKRETWVGSSKDVVFSLNASTVAVQGADVYDEVHPLAFSDSYEELLVFAGLHGIPLKESSSCQGAEIWL